MVWLRLQQMGVGRGGGGHPHLAHWLYRAKLARSGDLSGVRVPDGVDEAVRALVRAREDAVREQRNGRHRLKALLLRNGAPYIGKTSWTAAHLRWLATVKFD